MLLNIALMFLTGFVIGSVAYMLVPGGSRAGIVRTALVGVVGSVLAGIVLTVLVGTTGGLIGAVLGAVALIWIGRLRHEHAATA
jgi:uncharacterized membrane protein YeaQ/YmgE (transglycosylase-associated protein family)